MPARPGFSGLVRHSDKDLLSGIHKVHVKSDVRLFYFRGMESPINFTTHIHRLEYLLNVRYLEIPPEIVDQLGGISKQRLLCTVNDTLTFQCGMVALGEGKGYITLNKKQLKSLGVDLGDEVRVSLKPDNSKYGMDVPAELEEWLSQDTAARERFDGLSPGKQRYIIYYVSGVKSPQKRMERTALLMENLKRMPEGMFSFRFLLGKE